MMRQLFGWLPWLRSRSDSSLHTPNNVQDFEQERRERQGEDELQRLRERLAEYEHWRERAK